MKKLLMLLFVLIISLNIFGADATPTTLSENTLTALTGVDLKAKGDHTIYYPFGGSIYMVMDITPASTPSTITFNGGDFFNAEDLEFNITNSSNDLYFLGPLETIRFIDNDGVITITNDAAFTKFTLYIFTDIVF